jgi:hypothetical protein
MGWSEIVMNEFFVDECIAKSGRMESKLSEFPLSILGMSNSKVRHLLNNLAERSANILEVGTYNGSTFCSILDGNQIENSFCIDFYSEVDAAHRSTIGTDSLRILESNISKVDTKSDPVVFDRNCLSFDFSKEIACKIDFLFYDGPHEEAPCVKTLKNIYPILDDNFSLVVDDFSDGVQRGAIFSFLSELNITVNFSRSLPGNERFLDNQDNSGYFNGIGIFSCSKLSAS